jgi:fluoroacetyl-CoA thioesterase
MEVSHHTVTDADTADHLGSGDLPVLATPRLINWIERAAFGTAAEGLEPGQTTVGTLVKVEHIKASPVGTTVHVKSSRPVSDGRRLIFHVRVLDDAGEVVAVGEVQRAVIDRDRFMRRFGCTPDGTTVPRTEDAPSS